MKKLLITVFFALLGTSPCTGMIHEGYDEDIDVWCERQVRSIAQGAYEAIVALMNQAIDLRDTYLNQKAEFCEQACMARFVIEREYLLLEADDLKSKILRLNDVIMTDQEMLDEIASEWLDEMQGLVADDEGASDEYGDDSEEELERIRDPGSFDFSTE